MRPDDIQRAEMLSQALERFSRESRALRGIEAPEAKAVLIEQILESMRRVRYVSVVRTRHISPLRIDPNSDLFDPLKGAVYFQRHGNIEEACWMVFLFVHFGKNRISGWRLARDVYGRLGGEQRWDWAQVRVDSSGFRSWLRANEFILRGDDGVTRGFGNHRKYQSLNATSSSGTGAAVETYVNWVMNSGSHEVLFREAERECSQDARITFDKIYRSMKGVSSFGRLARFDYLTMIGKLQLANIEPGSTYMEQATGPLTGGCLLFGDNQLRRSELDELLISLDEYLSVGMQVLEDSICNWQKSPTAFKPFRG